jgi:hypothetical protein
MAQVQIDERQTIDAAIAGRVSVSAFVKRLAARAGVAYRPELTDQIAASISRLSDAEHVPDGVEDLLLALQRAAAITEAERFGLHAAYLRQKAE